MTQIAQQDNSAWGLEFGGSCVRLVHVARDGEGYRIESCRHVPLAQRWSAAGSANVSASGGAAAILPGMLQGLEGLSAAQPLALAVPDEAVLYRWLELPPADGPTRAKMVQAQLEVLLPSRADRFVAAWSAGDANGAPGPQTVLMAAARRDVLEQARALARPLAPEPAAMPAAVATAAGYVAAYGPAEAPLVLLDVGARATSVIVIRAGRVLRCSTLDQGADGWVRQVAAAAALAPAEAEAVVIAQLQAPDDDGGPPGAGGGTALGEALRDWLNQLAEVYHALIRDMPRNERPAEVVLLGRPAQAPPLAGLVGAALAVRVRTPAASTRVRAGEGISVTENLTALGAAVELLGGRPGMSFTARTTERPLAAPSLGRRWRLAAAWLLGAVLLLYAADGYESWWLASRLDAMAQHDEKTGGLDQSLAVGRLIEKPGAPPLMVLDAIATALPRPMVLTGWTYARDGDIRVITTLPQPNQVEEYLKALSASPLLRNVELKSMHSKGGQWECEVAATLSPNARLSMMTPHAAKPATGGAKPPAIAPDPGSRVPGVPKPPGPSPALVRPAAAATTQPHPPTAGAKP